MSHWTVDEHKTESPYWLVLKDAQYEENVYPHWSFRLKWDGCCHLNEAGIPGEEGDYWHVCGGVRAFDELIERLQEAKALAEKFFVDKYHREEWGFNTNTQNERTCEA